MKAHRYTHTHTHRVLPSFSLPKYLQQYGEPGPPNLSQYLLYPRAVIHQMLDGKQDRDMNSDALVWERSLLKSCFKHWNKSLLYPQQYRSWNFVENINHLILVQIINDGTMDTCSQVDDSVDTIPFASSLKVQLISSQFCIAFFAVDTYPGPLGTT